MTQARAALAELLGCWQGTVTAPGAALVSDGAIILARPVCANEPIIAALERRIDARRSVTEPVVETCLARAAERATVDLSISEQVTFFDGGTGVRLSNGAYLELRRFDLVRIAVGWALDLFGSGPRDPVVAKLRSGKVAAVLMPLRVAGCESGEWN